MWSFLKREPCALAVACLHVTTDLRQVYLEFGPQVCCRVLEGPLIQADFRRQLSKGVMHK